MKLTDEVLAEILGDAEFDIADGRDVFRTHPRVVADILQELQRLRAFRTSALETLLEATLDGCQRKRGQPTGACIPDVHFCHPCIACEAKALLDEEEQQRGS